MTRAGFGYQPALDGLRALSVLAVLLFHAEVAGFGGGYLGVSVFFTLSGYLITSLMLVERERTGGVAIGAFYVRRAKRLLPASLLCVAAIVVLAATTTWFDGAASLRRDLTGAVLQVANWVFLSGGGSYQDLFARSAGAASPVEHYWSLAIEEQFYWMFPLAFVGLWRVAPSPRAATRVVIGTTGLTAALAPVVAHVWGPDAAYWATPARAAEILAGVLAAFVVHGRTLPSGWRWVAPPALATLAVAVVLFPSDHGPAYAGALPIVGVVSTLLIVGLQVPGPLRAALSAPPLVALGRISYGVYLFHWPVFVALDESRTGLRGVALVGARLAATLLVALVSYVLVEQPVRAHVGARPLRVGAGAAVATVAVALAVVIAVDPGRGDYWRSADVARAAQIEAVAEGTLPPLAAAATTTVEPTSVPSASATVDTTPTNAPATDAPATTAPATTAPATSAPAASAIAPLPPLSRPVRVVVVGDSTAEATGVGLAQWAIERPDLAQVSLLAAEGCGFLRDGEFDAGEWMPYSDACASWRADLPRRVRELQPDVVMLMTTSWDVLDRRWAGGPVLTPLDAEYRGRLRADLGDVVTRALDAGAAHVVFVRGPVPVPLWGYGGEQAQSDPARHEVVGSVMAEVAAEHPARVSVVDLNPWLASVGLATDRDVRPDGVHWTPDVAARIAREELGEALVRAALGL